MKAAFLGSHNLKVESPILCFHVQKIQKNIRQCLNTYASGKILDDLYFCAYDGVCVCVWSQHAPSTTVPNAILLHHRLHRKCLPHPSIHPSIRSDILQLESLHTLLII